MFDQEDLEFLNILSEKLDIPVEKLLDMGLRELSEIAFDKGISIDFSMEPKDRGLA